VDDTAVCSTALNDGNYTDLEWGCKTEDDGSFAVRAEKSIRT
jgi:hypothetical protein